MIDEVDEPSTSTFRKSEYFDAPFNKQEMYNLNEINKLNLKLSKLVDFKKKRLLSEKKPKKNSKSPLRYKHKIALHKLKVDAKDLSPQFYKNLNPTFINKSSFKKKHVSLRGRKFITSQNKSGSKITSQKREKSSDEKHKIKFLIDSRMKNTSSSKKKYNRKKSKGHSKDKSLNKSNNSNK